MSIWRGPAAFLGANLSKLTAWRPEPSVRRPLHAKMSANGSFSQPASATRRRPPETRGRRGLRLVAAPFLALLLLGTHEPAARAFPIASSNGPLPAGTELGEGVPETPRELFRSEVAGGKRSDLLDLGDMAFSSPALFGGAARAAGLSCATCHVAGAGNARLFVPGMSTRPGNFDTTGGLFNPQADNGRLDPLTTPSLRGARFLAPYGHDGRNASLRDFVRAVIVGEFAGAEPSARILDALVTYIQEIDFLPNPRLGPMGKLAAGASDAERRGEALFARPFPQDASLSCAGCHVPGGAFVDHVQHDIGTGGFYKTPTLINANFNAPYFHDGRFDTYEPVVDYFNKTFALGLSAEDRGDLVAYLGAVGDGTRAYEPSDVDGELVELETFDRVLSRALASRDAATVALAVDTIGGELRELEEFYPARKDTSVAGGLAERGAARAAIKDLVLNLRRVESAASAGYFDVAGAELASYRTALGDARVKLEAAAPWSLYNPAIRQAHDDALRRLYAMAVVQSAP